MIDTLKIITSISKDTYNYIHNQSNIKTSYNYQTGEIFYKIVNDSITGSYNSSLSIRVGDTNKYNLNTKYYIEIEGSYHKLIKGYNSHNGFYNISFIANELIKIAENYYNVKLPSIKKWFIQRIDIAICFDLHSQNNIETYIDNLGSCDYPKRKLKHYQGESIYLTGSTTTLKIYNKFIEFKKHDLSNFKDTNFNISNYCDEIKGFIRFECEIRKRKLQSYFNKKYIRVYATDYLDLRNIWEEEFRKFFKMIDNDIKKIYKKEDVRTALNSHYKPIRSQHLYNFYILVKALGLDEVKKTTCKSVYYKNIADLKKANIDFSQKMNIDMQDIQITFNPFEAMEIP